jgi:hypothetical protein
VTVNNIATLTGLNVGYPGAVSCNLLSNPSAPAACCGVVKTTTQERNPSLANQNQTEAVENRNSSADLSIRDVCDRTEIAFVDPNLAHQGILAKAWRHNVEAIVLEATRSANEQIYAAL